MASRKPMIVFVCANPEILNMVINANKKSFV